MQDNARLRAHARAVTHGETRPTEIIVALTHWVYGTRGFAKNPHYYLLKPLGPTPMQIMKAGGDCADKSRLLSAMLNELGFSSGLVMISPCSNCPPIHTVVEAAYGGGRMVVDPVWDVDYRSISGLYYGVRELAGTSLGRERIASLKSQRGPTAKIRLMPDSEATFDFAVGINWNKNFVTRTVASLLHIAGIDTATVMRPRIMEDPKMAVFSFLLFLSLGGFTSGLLSAVFFRRQRLADQLESVTPHRFCSTTVHDLPRGRER